MRHDMPPSLPYDQWPILERQEHRPQPDRPDGILVFAI
jgi:hypothetical protein